MRTHSLTAAAAVVALFLTTSTVRIADVSIATPTPTSTTQRLTITGEGFLPGLSLAMRAPGGGSQVFKDSDIQSPTASSFMVSAMLAEVGTYSLVVTNPDGGVSEPFALHVPPVAPGPIIDTVTPSTPMIQQTPQPLRVEGKRFVSGLTASLTDPAGAVTTIAGDDVRQITSNSFLISAVLDLEGQYTLIVVNPDGGKSNAVTVSAAKRRIPVGLIR